MPVYRVVKNKDFTTISNYHLRDKELSLKAKGLLTMVLSFDSKWDYSIAGLASVCKEGEKAVKSALDELKERGYLTVEKIPPQKGKNPTFDYLYSFYEKPQSLDPQKVGLQDVAVQNGGQRNTKERNTEKRKKSEGITKYPTVDEARQYANESDLPDYAEEFVSYWESVGWKRRNGSKMTNWKAGYRNWCINQKKYDSAKPVSKYEKKSPYQGISADLSAAFHRTPEEREAWLRGERKK